MFKGNKIYTVNEKGKKAEFFVYVELKVVG